MNSAYYCNVNVQDRESTCLHNVDSGASEFCSSISSNHPQCEFGCGFWTLPPVTAPPVTEPVDDESFCAAQCQAAGNCCNDPSVGSNQQISCAQACMMRASGQRMDAMLSANGGICNRAGNSGCSLEVQGQSYSFCSSCQDLQEHCPHGVQSSDECDFGASLLPPSAVVDPVHMDLQVVCDVDACFARCESFYGGSLDTGDAYYCAKGCAPNSASTSMNSAYYCNVNVQDRESTCLHNVDSGASEFCSSISSNHPQCEFGCGFWTLPPVTAPPVTEPVDDESFCAAQCQAAGNCCNDPSVGSNQQISCAQACMMRASGQRMDAMLSANGGICNRAGNSGCSLEVQGQSYSFCSSCQDLQEHCPHGVQSSDECDFGASLLPPSAVVDPEPVTAAPE